MTHPIRPIWRPWKPATSPTSSRNRSIPRVRLPDGYEATLDEVAEWRKGNLRQSDYTRKTQELAEQRRHFGAQWQAFAQNQQAMAQALDQAIAVVSHFMPQPPSDDLRTKDFFAWQERKAEFDAQAGKLQGLQAQRVQLARTEAYKQQQQMAHHLQREQQALLALKTGTQRSGQGGQVHRGCQKICGRKRLQAGGRRTDPRPSAA